MDPTTPDPISDLIAGTTGEREKIAVGVSTYAGYIATAATAAVPLIQWALDLAPANTQLIWLSGLILALTGIGRYAQAVAKVLRTGSTS